MRALAVAAVLLALLVAMAPRPAVAQQPPAPILGVEVTMSRAQLNVGDRVLLTLRIKHRSDVAVTANPDAPEEIEFGKPAVTTLALPDGVVQTTVTWTVQPFVLGPIALRAFPVAWVTQDGRTGRFLVQPPRFEVQPIRAADDVGLRPLKDPVTVPGGPPAWLKPTLIGLALVVSLAAVVVLAWLLVRWARTFVRRRRGGAADVPVPVVVTAESSARESLDGLTGLVLRDAEAFEQYYGTIAVVVRRYLSERIGFNAHALTTEELERRMTAQGVDRWQARLVGGLLERCDAAVYAHRFPDPASADHDLTVAYEIVELSRPGAPRTGVIPRGATA
ncbi:MAG: hypothetical protein EPO65_12870 [Dehalococcoidia bacterium]|nr:MAG: hypothetical protein EPO65_12870 [Dehalococcoidia bacterium]